MGLGGRRGGRTVGLGGAFDPLGVSAIPARSPSRLLALANRAAAPARSTIVASPGDSDEPATPSSSSLGTTPCPQSAQW